MNKQIACALIPFLAIFFIGFSAPAHPQKAQPERQGSNSSGLVEHRDLFEGNLTLKSKQGKPISVHVTIRQWDILRGTKVEKFDEQGFTVVQLLGGQIHTVIAGNKQPRRHGEFWILPAGSPMSVEVSSEEAVLQTIAVRRP